MRSIHHEMRALSFFRVGHLPRQNRRELFLGHIRAGENPLALKFRRGRDDDHRINTLLASGFEQQGDIDHRDWRARLLGILKELVPGGAQRAPFDAEGRASWPRS